jgi:bile acid:Na+ symporter, BASS family
MMIAKLAAAVMLIALTFGAGLQVNRPHLMAILKNYGLLGRALLANVIIVPLLGVIFARLFRLSAPVATGYLLMAIAPGVPFVLASVRKRGGRLGLAVALAIILPLVSIVTVPLTARFVLPVEAQAELPLGHFIVTLLLFQLVPLLLGMVVGERFPRATPDLGRFMQILFFLAVIVLFALLAKKLVHDVASVYGSNGMWAMLCLVLLSLGTGWVLGGPAREDRRILGIGTALRNIGLAAVISTSSFHDSLIAASVLTYFLIQFIVTTLVGVYFTRTAQRAVA